MTVKKLNAVCSWVLLALLIGHVATTTAFLLTGWFDMKLFVVLPRILAVVCVIHVCLSLFIVFFLHDGSDVSKYGKMSQRTIVQRASGLLILALVHPHVKLFSSFIYEGLPLTGLQKLGVFLVEILFFGSVFTHIECSFSRSLISMGLIRTDAAEKRVDYAARTLCALLFAFTMFSLARFLIFWQTA